MTTETKFTYNILPDIRTASTITDLAERWAPPSWKDVFEEAMEDFMEVDKRIFRDKKRGLEIAPPLHLTFAAFEYTPLDKVRVVIFGQDPYFGKNANDPSIPQATGLAFSVARNDKIPSSLMNMFKELHRSMTSSEEAKLRQEIYGSPEPRPVTLEHGDLTPWARQGVLLLNTALTVPVGAEHKRAHMGLWSGFIHQVIEAINELRTKVVFVLMGGDAKKLKSKIASKHKILETAHPSGLSAHRGFFGSNVFLEVDRHLISTGTDPMNWSLVRRA